MSDILQKKISNLIPSQFPTFYLEEGPVFVRFVQDYYRWMESVTPSRANTWINEKLSYITVQSGNSVIVGSNTKFSTYFTPGSSIAIPRDPDKPGYTIYTVNSVANSTYLTISEVPDFSIPKTKYTTVANTANPLFMVRSYNEIHDIDETFENYLVHFKEKYLKNLQFVSESDIRMVVKHSLDLYRSKGTERAIELLFRLAFGITPEIYYPASDLFKLSDGKWYVPQYLEVTLRNQTNRLINKEIIGLHSGATAFVEGVVRKTVNGKFIDVIYISAIHGTFMTGEPVNSTDFVLSVGDTPAVIGSLTNVVISSDGVGSGYSVGDILDVTSEFGRQGKVRVASVANTSGQVNFSLTSGGYGYSNTPIVSVSDAVLTISNLRFSNTSISSYAQLFDKLVQPTAFLNYVSANGTFAIDNTITTYYANNSVKGTGRILTLDAANSTTGTMRVSVLSGNLNATNIYTSSNLVTAALSISNGYYDVTATGNVYGIGNTYNLTVDTVTGTFGDGDYVFQKTNGKVTGEGFVRGGISLASGTFLISAASGVFKNTSPIYSNSGATCNLVSSEIRVGVKLSNTNSFINSGNNYCYFSSNNGGNGVVTVVSTGTGANVRFSSSLLYPEYINLNTDVIGTYSAVRLNANSFGFPANTTGNISSNTISKLLAYSNTQIGKISSILSINRGKNYNYPPFVVVVEPKVAAYNKPSYVSFSIANSSAGFQVGELVTQTSSGARGIIVAGNSSSLTLERMNFYDANTFKATTNATTQIYGTLSGATANIASVIGIANSYLGNNAIISKELNISNGAITSLEVTDSGFGFVDNESVTIYSDGQEISGVASVTTSGKGTGYYIDKGGFLSDQKKLFDGDYYQFYSYEIRSSKTLDKYENMLKSIVHVAGTKPFAAYYHDTELIAATDIETEVTIS